MKSGPEDERVFFRLSVNAEVNQLFYFAHLISLGGMVVMVVMGIKSACTAQGINMTHEDVQVEKNSSCFVFISLLFSSSLCLLKAVLVHRRDAHMNHTYFAYVNARSVRYFFFCLRRCTL